MKRKNSKKNKKVITKERRSYLSLPEEIKRWIWGAVLFLVAVIVILSFFDKAEVAGENLMKVLTFLIGKAAFIIPMILVLGGMVFFNPKYKGSLRLAVLAMLVLVLGISGILASITPGENLGGQVGYFIAFPLLKLLGPVVSRITFGLVIIISLLLFWYLFGKPSFRLRRFEPTKGESSETLDRKHKQVFIKKIFEPKFKVKEVPSNEILDEKEILPTAFLKKQVTEDATKKTSYKFPPPDLLEKDKGGALAGDIKINSAIIKRTLQNFDIQVEMSEVSIGPTVTRYALKPAEGVKLSKIVVLSNDLSMALASHPIRIEAPIPGRPLVGIEVPNRVRAIIRLRDLIEHPNFQNSESSLAFCLGRDVAGHPLFADLAKMPHLLVAGATGTGKTICLNTIILSLLYKNSPQDLKLILVDPKRVEFPVYNDLPHLLCPVIFNPQKAINALKWLIGEMERRFEVLSQAKAKDITEFNRICLEKPDWLEPLPFIILIIDELADFMAARGREMEAGIVRLAQMSRAVGIHLILATQRPSVEVITGLIKANITSRITFQVASQVDSRTVLDMAGAEKLLGLGDMLFISAEKVKPRRVQGVFISEKEVKRVVKFIASNSELLEREDISKEIEAEASKSLNEALEKSEFLTEEDPLYEEAKRVVIEARKASASLLQRRLRIGYARAARLIDTLEERNIVGPGEGAKPREVYIGTEEET